MTRDARSSLFSFLRRTWCRVVGHDESYYESVPRGGYFVCFRCGFERPE